METKSYSQLLMLILLLWIVSVSFAASLLNEKTTILNHGNIGVLSPLHVEGRYIKDSFNNTVILRGVVKVEFADQPGGTWMGNAVMDYSSWNTANVKSELAIMKSKGINVISIHQAIEHWKFNLGNNRQIIKEFLDIAASFGMYVVYRGYSVRNYWNGGNQDPLPYPPYSTSNNASAVIASKSDFVSWWTSVASELKNYSNVLFCLWAEPQGNATAQAEWFNVEQQCINAIRATAAKQLIILQWSTGVWVNLNFPLPPSPSSTMSWVWQANLTDPLGNLVYSCDLYRSGGAFTYSVPTYSYAWNMTDIQRAFEYFLFPQVLISYPLYIGEFGANIAYTGEELDHELLAFDNCLTLFDQMGISYTAFWWRNIGIYALNNGPPSFMPNAAGQILETHLIAPETNPAY